MKVSWFLTIALLAVALGGANAQLALGPGGFKAPPINLLSVFRFLRDIFMSYMYPPAVTGEPLLKTGEQKLIPVDDDELSHITRPDPDRVQKVSVMGFDTKGNIVEKFDSGCLEDDDGNCTPILAEEEEEVTTEAFSSLQDPPLDRTGAVVEDKTGSSQIVVGKWPVLYVSLISVMFWLFVIVATPYILTGETISRRDDDVSSNYLFDQQDTLLLLSWLLGEASNDVSCLERVVCLTPTKSSKYISVSSMVFNVANYLQRWVPYSPRFDNLLNRLEDVALDGFSQECHNYYCPTVPDL